MNFESYKQIMLCEKDKDVVLRKGKSLTLDFDIEDENAADRIFMTGETALFYNWKTEPDYQYLYRRIDDSLSSSEANKTRFALDMSADNFDYPKIAYHKILWWPRFYGGGSIWRTGISAKAEDLKIHEGGYLRLLVEIRYVRAGVDKRLVYTEPDLTAVINIPEGSYGWSDFEKAFPPVTASVSSVCVYVEGMRYSGKVFFEKPYFCSENGVSILHDFVPFLQDKPEFNWLGVNLSRVEWPSFTVKLNGETIYDGEVFERCHRYSEWEFTIPRGVAKEGKNTLEITHTSDYRDVAPYNIHELGVVYVRRDVLLWCPEVVSVGEEFPVLLKTERDGLAFTLDAPYSISVSGELKCEKAGLNVLRFICNKPQNDLSFCLESDCGRVECNIARVVERSDDGVITGTGDMVYINQNKRDFENYISWYLTNDIGKLLTVRPTYRWCGSRAADGRLWRETADLLDSLGIKTSHMRDGRELQGCNANPTLAEMESASFLGRQTHELDGAYVYWSRVGKDASDNLNEQMFNDLFVRFFLKDHERMNVRFSPATYYERCGRLENCRDHTIPRDMEALANFVVNSLAASRDGSTRHTGPATLFKYFYQAGYTWTGAELMYSSNEVTCAALRGAAKVYGSKVGGHLATQWSTTPHDTIEHSKRYRLALYNTYMQGVDEINTEEGLWRMEEYFAYHNRFSPACLDHLKEQKDFNRYVLTHTRSGSYYTPVAILNGRYDGMKYFGGKNTLWGRSDIQYGDPENAWDMLDVFYPLSRHGAIYRHSCPKDKPVGFYSGTPMGGVDILPIEAKDFDGYKLLCAIAYNKALTEDMDKLSSYVSGGGKLFIGLAQLATTTLRADIEKYNLDYIDHSFVKAIAPEISFVDDCLCGAKIRVNVNLPEGAKVLKQTDSGSPLIYEISVGNGVVYVLNTLEYAGNPAIYSNVKDFVASLSAESFAEEVVWARGDDRVQFAVFSQEDGSKHVYFLAIDWFDASAPMHTAALRVGEYEYPVEVHYGTMIKAVASGNVAAWFDSEDCDVLEIAKDGIKVQGVGIGILNIAQNGKVKKVETDFADSSVKTIII